MKETLCTSPGVEWSRDWKFSHGVSSSLINNNSRKNTEGLQTSYASLPQLCDRLEYLGPGWLLMSETAPKDVCCHSNPSVCFEISR